MSRLRLFVLPALLVVTATPSFADDAASALCRLVMHQEQVERDELELAVELERSKATAAGEIFELLDGLWKNDAVERLVYLAGKHERDVTRLSHERLRLLLERQEAVVEQYHLLCEGSGTQRRSVDDARRSYHRADCASRIKDLAIAEVDLAYRRELLVSMRDLRENNVATRQQVIRAERDVEMANRSLEQAKRRRCEN